jgi:hypothetical protein
MFTYFAHLEPFYHSLAEPQPKTRTLTTEATEEHGGKPKSKPTAERAEKAEIRRAQVGVGEKLAQ